MSEELVRNYLENNHQLKLICNKQEELRKQVLKQIRELEYDIYQPRIRALYDERDAKIQELREKKDEKISDGDKQIDTLLPVISKVDRIIAFLKVKIVDLTIADTAVNTYGDNYCESLGYLFDDEYLKIKLFIAENSKPKNKYSLIAIGRCTFNEHLCKLPYSYGLPTYEHGWYSLKQQIIDRPTIKELKEYLQKWKTKILSQLTGNFAEIKKEYEEVLQTYTSKDFEALKQYVCKKCGFFYTSKEISSISIRNNVTCPNCRENMVKIETGR